MSEIEIQWLGHSCYQIRKDGYTIVTDPYRDGEVPGYRPLRTEGDQILSSHGHADHNAVECVTLTGSGRECPWEITKIHSWHDEEGGSLRGDNTIFVLEDDSYRIAFMGDFGCDLPEEDMARLMGVDVMLIPVGGFFTLPPEHIRRIVEELKPTVVVPMHYRFGETGYPLIGTLDAYTDLCDDVVVYETDTLRLPENLTKQTAVLKYLG